MPRSKVVQDPVHGSIEVDGVFLDVMDRHEMQRLRSVRQLGLGNLVFPAANHTRFEHCLGTYHLAGRMADAISLDEEDSNAVRMAGLLHDICHPPFSHALEPVMEDATGMDHMELARALIFGDIPDHLPESDDILGGLPSIAELIEAAGISAEDVCGLIAYPESTGEEALDRFWNKHEYFPSKDYAHQIIHGPVDADQMDYLMRDAHHTGVSHGSIDSERLIKTMMVMNDRIVLRRGGITAAEGLMVSRSLMYTTVYFHETVRIAQRMLVKAVEGSGLDLSDMYLRGDADLMAMVSRVGGKPSRNIRRIQARMLDKKAFAVYSEDMTDEKAEVLLQYTGREGSRRLEQEVGRVRRRRRGHVEFEPPGQDEDRKDGRRHSRRVRAHKVPVQVLPDSQVPAGQGPLRMGGAHLGTEGGEGRRQQGGIPGPRFLISPLSRRWA